MQQLKKRLTTVKTINFFVWAIAAALCCYLIFKFGETMAGWI